MKNHYLHIPLLLVLTFCCIQNARGQAVDKQVDREALVEWLSGLYEQGVSFENDSLIISEESNKVLNDSIYRKLIYPKVYNWDQAMRFVQSQELNKAFWYFINLYSINDQNKELVLKCLATYDDLFIVDKMLISTFYTYCYMDPQIGQIVDGTTDITAPHILEAKLRTVKELIYYLDAYRKSK